MKLSKSQLTCFNASKAEWAGKYIMGIKNEIKNDSLLLGKIAEERLINKKDDYSILEQGEVQDMEKLILEYDGIKSNAEGLEIPKGISQVKVEGELMGELFVGFIDLLADDTIIDIKTTRYPNKKEDGKVNMRSGLTSYEEYELQLWIYMSLTGLKKAQIIEVAKHQYKDGRKAHQVFDINWSDEINDRMLTKWQPIVKEMGAMYRQYSNFIQE